MKSLFIKSLKPNEKFEVSQEITKSIVGTYKSIYCNEVNQVLEITLDKADGSKKSLILRSPKRVDADITIAETDRITVENKSSGYSSETGITLV